MSRVTFLGALFAAVLSVSLVCAQEKKEGGKGGKGGDRPRPTPEQIFEKLDADHDGSLTLEELLKGPMGQKGDKSAVEARFKRMDANGDGKVSADEFKKALGSMGEKGGHGKGGKGKGPKEGSK